MKRLIKIRRRHFMPNLERYAAACSHRTKSKTPKTFHLNNPECGLYTIRIRTLRPQKFHLTSPGCSLYGICIRTPRPQKFHLTNPGCSLYAIRIRTLRPQTFHLTNPKCGLYTIRIRMPRPQKFHLTNLLDSTQTRAEDMQLSMQTNSLPTVKRNIKHTAFKHFLHTRLVPLHKIA